MLEEVSPDRFLPLCCSFLSPVVARLVKERDVIQQSGTRSELRLIGRAASLHAKKEALAIVKHGPSNEPDQDFGALQPQVDETSGNPFMVVIPRGEDTALLSLHLPKNAASIESHL